MTYLRILRLLGRIVRILNRIPLRDRWGVPLGDDLDDRLVFKQYDYWLKVDELAGFIPVEFGERCTPDHHLGTTYLLTWPEGRGTCNKCGPVTYTTASAS